jgi:hypothetical protein
VRRHRRRAESALYSAASRIVVGKAPAGTVRAGRPRSAAEQPASDRQPAQVRRDALYDAAAEVSAARHSAETAVRDLSGRQAGAADAEALLIEGPAGCGNSHLVADAAVARAREGLPTLLVLGQHLQPGPVWPQIAHAADVAMTGEELRAALEVAARLRGSGRALLADLPRAILPDHALLNLLCAQWSGADAADARGLSLGPVETEYSWTSQGRIVAFSTAGRSYGSTTMLLVRADALADALDRAGLAMWTWLLGEKIYWLGEDPQPQRAEVYAAADLTGSRPTVWGLTIEHVDWDGQDRPRSRLIRQRPPSSRTARPARRSQTRHPS